VLFAVALIITVILILYGEYVIRDLQGRAFISNDLFWVTALQVTVFVVFLYSTISTLYYFGTKEEKSSRFFSLGALVTTLLFLATTYFFGIYINNFSTYNELYGSLGALLIMLLYIWINSNLLLLGFELNITLQRLRNNQNESN
jgi:membrane protein